MLQGADLKKTKGTTVEKAHLVKWIGSETLPAGVNRDRGSLVLLVMSLISLFQA